MNPDVSRQMWKAMEPVHAMVYFAPEPQEEYVALGLGDNRAAGYFPARAAAMGAVSQGTVVATFYGFSPLAVLFGMTGAWEATTPEALQAARYRGVDRALRRMCGDLLDDVSEALALARTATEGCRPEGRALYAANAGLAWPQEDHLALWHAIALLREYRGDGHLAALVVAGISAPQALVLNGALNGPVMTEFLKQSRGWTPEEWDAAVAELAAQGLVTADGALTAAGEAAREEVEAVTDRAALAPWAHLGEDGCARLRELVTPLSKAVIASGGFPVARKA